MSPEPLRDKSANRQLRGWKEIATLLGKDESTVKRWAVSRGLPVHRVPGQKRASVYAWSEDINNWLVGHDRMSTAQRPSEDIAKPAPTVFARAGRHWKGLTAGILIAGFTLVAGIPAALAVWNAGYLASTGDYQPSDKVRNLYLDGVYLYQKRTPESLKLAAASLELAINLDPAFAAAQAAAAVTYDLMVEYRLLEPNEGYAHAEAAARKALSLDSRQAEAHAVLGDIAFFREHDYQRGLAHFGQSIAIDPKNALSRHWYASALLCVGRYQDALREIVETQRLDPSARSVLVSKAMILLANKDVAGSEEVLTRLVANEPGYRSTYRFLSFVALAKRDYKAYLSALRTRFELTQDKAGLLITAAGERAYLQGGAEAMAKAMVVTAATDPAAETVEPYFRAHILALSGDIESAAAQLAGIKTRHAFYYGIDPAFAEARAQPSFLGQVKAMGLPVIR